jgi:hypothetical protein
MHLVYIDDSQSNSRVYYSALIIPAELWQRALDHQLVFRRLMKTQHGIYVKKEMHATEWLGGRGKIAPQLVSKQIRAQLFRDFLTHLTKMPGAQIVNATGHDSKEEVVFERLLNRIQKNMVVQGSRALIISDEGKDYDTLLRKMRRFNPIPSQYGRWGPSQRSKSIPLNRIIEDIVYRNSARSLMIQAADACAFSFLRKEIPTARLTALNIHTAFDLLDPILVKAAAAKDPQGIVRV